MQQQQPTASWTAAGALLPAGLVRHICSAVFRSGLPCSEQGVLASALFGMELLFLIAAHTVLGLEL